MQFILFDCDGRPVKIHTPIGDRPPESVMKSWRAKSYKPVSECTQQEYEDAFRKRFDERSTEGKRQRAGGSGYSGGDGFKQI